MEGERETQNNNRKKESQNKDPALWNSPEWALEDSKSSSSSRSASCSLLTKASLLPVSA